MSSLGLRPRDDMSTSGQHIWMFHLQPCIICIMWAVVLAFAYASQCLTDQHLAIILFRGFAAGWTAVEMSTPHLPEDDAETNVGQSGDGGRFTMKLAAALDWFQSGRLFTCWNCLQFSCPPSPPLVGRGDLSHTRLPLDYAHSVQPTFGPGDAPATYMYTLLLHLFQPWQFLQHTVRCVQYYDP